MRWNRTCITGRTYVGGWQQLWVEIPLDDDTPHLLRLVLIEHVYGEEPKETTTLFKRITKGEDSNEMRSVRQSAHAEGGEK